MPWRRLVILSVLLLLLAGVGTITWRLLDLPPLRLAWKYGLTPTMAPTGQTRNVEGIEFVEIGPGCFRMGSTRGAEEGDLLGRICGPLGLPWGKQPKSTDEMPVHWVEFARGFWMARTEITNEIYERYAPEHERPESSAGDDHAVVYVSPEDARRFCAWLSEKSGLAIRLPSESEWECACRGGTETKYSFGDDEKELLEHAWFSGICLETAPEVATRKPNAWGLHDFLGNVHEWCEDTWHDSYEGAPRDGSAWISGGTSGRVYRGGCRFDDAGDCRSANRNWYPPSNISNFHGFRLAFSGPSED